MLLTIEEIKEKINTLTDLGINLIESEIDKLYECKNDIQLDNVARSIMSHHWNKPVKRVYAGARAYS